MGTKERKREKKKRGGKEKRRDVMQDRMNLATRKRDVRVLFFFPWERKGERGKKKEVLFLFKRKNGEGDIFSLPIIKAGREKKKELKPLHFRQNPFQFLCTKC